jgi:enoyl-CoA hydratase
MILTGRPVSGDEAFRMGLANRLVEKGEALASSIALAEEIAAFPQRCLRSDRLASYEQWGMSIPDALKSEFYRGKQVIDSGETAAGARRFAEGTGRHGSFAAFKKP